MKMRILPLLVLSILPTLGFSIRAADSDAFAILSSDIGVKDLSFLQATANNSIMQANIGELARKRGGSELLKLFGDALATSNRAIKNELQTLATLKGVSVSNTPNEQQIAILDRLAKLSGVPFEQTCIDVLAKRQVEEAADFENAALSRDPDVKAFAVKFLPQMREQLVLMKRLTAPPAKTGGSPLFRTTLPDRGKQ
jgi:putative membrane protein